MTKQFYFHFPGASSTLPPSYDEVVGDKEIEIIDHPEIARLFSKLQIMTAIFGSFTHGGNDVR